MNTAAAGSVAPETRKGRTAPTVQPSTEFVSSNVNKNNTLALRLQRLKRLGFFGHRAALLAHLAWGEAA